MSETIRDIVFRLRIEQIESRLDPPDMRPLFDSVEKYKRAVQSATREVEDSFRRQGDASRRAVEGNRSIGQSADRMSNDVQKAARRAGSAVTEEMTKSATIANRRMDSIGQKGVQTFQKIETSAQQAGAQIKQTGSTGAGGLAQLDAAGNVLTSTFGKITGVISVVNQLITTGIALWAMYKLRTMEAKEALEDLPTNVRLPGVTGPSQHIQQPIDTTELAPEDVGKQTVKPLGFWSEVIEKNFYRGYAGGERRVEEARALARQKQIAENRLNNRAMTAGDIANLNRSQAERSLRLQGLNDPNAPIEDQITRRQEFQATIDAQRGSGREFFNPATARNLGDRLRTREEIEDDARRRTRGNFGALGAQATKSEQQASLVEEMEVELRIANEIAQRRQQGIENLDAMLGLQRTLVSEKKQELATAEQLANQAKQQRDAEEARVSGIEGRIGRMDEAQLFEFRQLSQRAASGGATAQDRRRLEQLGFQQQGFFANRGRERAKALGLDLSGIEVGAGAGGGLRGEGSQLQVLEDLAAQKEAEAKKLRQMADEAQKSTVATIEAINAAKEAFLEAKAKAIEFERFLEVNREGQ